MTVAITTELQLGHSNLPVSSLEAYILRINQIPMLSREEEFDLASRLREQGDLQAAQRLVLSHLRHVVRVARGYLGYGLPLGDLIQEGTIGLMKAIKRFDPTVGVRLVSFAVHWVKAEIHEYIIRNVRAVRAATTKAQRKLFFNLKKEKEARKLSGWLSQEAVLSVAHDLDVRPEEVRRMEERLSARDMAFDMSVEDGNGVARRYLEDVDADPAIQIEDWNWRNYSGEGLKVAFQSLDTRSRHILEKRFLAEEENRATLQELAAHYKVSAERIRQLEKNALLKLKKAFPT